jgi:tetratricopeptide (TPR) repeat protein
MFSIKHMPLSILLSTAFLLGCPKQTTAPGEGDNLDPNMEFVQGIKTLEKVDRKTGTVDYDTALAYFRSAVNLKPDFANAAYNAAWTSEQIGDMDQAISYYKKAYESKPTKDFLNAYVAVQKEAGQFEGALATLTDYVSKNPSDMDAQYSVIEVHTQMGNMDAALQAASEILLSNSTDITVYRLLSRTFYQNNKFDMSLLCAEKANEMLMSVAKEKGQPAKKDAGILNNMGVTYLAMKDEPSAIGYFQEALELEPNHVEANLNLGFIALNSGNYQFALEKFDAALVTNASQMSAKLGRAVALRGTQDLDGASKLYAQILKSSSADRIAYFNAATLEAKYQKDYKKAQQLLEEYKAANPSDTEVDQRLAELSTLQAEEAARKKAEEERRKAEEERKKRQQEKMNELKTAVSSLQASKDALASCAEAIDSGAIEMADMVLEQGVMVIEAEEIEMAGDVIPFVADTQATLDELKAVCGGGSAPAPTEGADEGSTEEAPAE